MFAAEIGPAAPIPPLVPPDERREWAPAFMVLAPGTRHHRHWLTVHRRLGGATRLHSDRLPRNAIGWWLLAADRTTLAVGTDVFTDLADAAGRVREIADAAHAGLLSIWRVSDTAGGHSWYATWGSELLLAGSRSSSTAHDANHEAQLAVHALAALPGFTVELALPSTHLGDEAPELRDGPASPIVDIGSRRPLRELSPQTRARSESGAEGATVGAPAPRPTTPAAPRTVGA